MTLRGVLRPGHVALRVLDMAAAVDHYTNALGLIQTGVDKAGRVYLKAWDEHDHHSVVLRQDDKAGMDYMGWRVESPQALEELAQTVEASGLARDMAWIEAGEHLETGRRFRFKIPTGHVMEFYAEKAKIGNGMSNESPDPWPDGLKGMQASRFDHCLLYGSDVAGTTELFTKVLGFSISEKVMAGEEMIGVFLTCSNKAHDVAFIKHPEDGRLHHASFNLDNWGEILRAADIISKKDISLDIGPTRHGITRGETIYFFDPSGNRNEVFSGGYIYYPDKPMITWKVEDLGKAIFYHDRKLNEAFLHVVT